MLAIRVFRLSAAAALVTAACLMAAAPARAAGADSPAVECRWTDAPIAIDGRAAETAWKRAAMIGDFRIAGAAGGKPRAATRAKLLWDREYLYLFAEMDDADLAAKATKAKGPAGIGDTLELFLQPDAQKTGYYEFAVNAAGAARQVFHPARRRRRRGFPSRGADRNARGRPPPRHARSSRRPGPRVVARGPDSLARSGGDGRPTDRGGNMAIRPLPRRCRERRAGHGVEQLRAALAARLSTLRRLLAASVRRAKGAVTADASQPSAGTIGAAGPPQCRLWTHSHVVGSPDPPPPYTVVRAFPRLTVKQPLYLLEEPGTDDFLLLQHLGSWVGPGKLLRFKNDPNVSTVETLLSFNRIAYGMTLDPDFIHNGYIYLMSNGHESAPGSQDRISRFTIDRRTHKIDPKSEKIIIEWDSNGHNGGDLAFGPDGYLYHASGDGSTDSDANLRGQDLTHLNGVMIRIDVHHPAGGKAYSVPKDNPFLKTPGRGRKSGPMASAIRGGWPSIARPAICGSGKTAKICGSRSIWFTKERTAAGASTKARIPSISRASAAPPRSRFPTVEHPHSEMRSLTGGVVYRGDKLPELRGAFIYGDWLTGRIWGVKDDGKKVTWHKELARTTLQITGFRETAAGDLLVIDHGGGFYRLVPVPVAAATPPFPKMLSATGLFLSTRDNRPDPALIPYDVNAPLWSDGAIKQRFIALPGDGKIDAGTSHGWNFPEGTVLVKTFSLETTAGNPASRRRIETRLLTKQLGQWAGYSYRWNDAQTDAALVAAAGEDVPFAIADSGRAARPTHANLALSQPNRVHGLPHAGGQFRPRPARWCR